MFSKQETFDKVVDHLRVQGAPAWNEVEGCAYQSIEGLKCAVGCLIPEDKYDPAFEGKGIYEDPVYGSGFSRVSKPSAVGRLMEELGHDLSLLDALQVIHDGVRQCQWEGRFKLLAQTHGLVYRKPNQASSAYGKAN